MIFSSDVDRCKTNPLIYVRFWRQACMPSLLSGAELFTLTPSLLLELERRQSWFLKKLFYVPDFAPSVRNLLKSRTESFFDKNVKSIGILQSICEALNKYDSFNYLEIWSNSSTFPTYGNWKSIVKNKVCDVESKLWLEFCSGHPKMHVAQACLVNVSPSKFWSLADFYPDLVSRLHIQHKKVGRTQSPFWWCFSSFNLVICCLCRW